MKIKLTKEEKKEAKKQRKAKGQGIIAEFKKFILRGNVIDMAVGVIVATAFTKIVTSLTNGVFMPLITWLIGDMKFDEVKTVLRPEIIENEIITQAEISISWGSVIEAIINFLLIAIIIFSIVKIINTIRAKLDYYKDKLLKREEEKALTPAPAPVPPAPTTNELLGEIIVLLKEQNNSKEENK